MDSELILLFCSGNSLGVIVLPARMRCASDLARPMSNYVGGILCGSAILCCILLLCIRRRYLQCHHLKSK